jgi:hypothetical protein
MRKCRRTDGLGGSVRADPGSWAIYTCDGTGGFVVNQYLEDTCGGVPVHSSILPWREGECVWDDDGQNYFRLSCGDAGAEDISYVVYSDASCSIEVAPFPVPRCDPQCDDDEDEDDECEGVWARARTLRARTGHAEGERSWMCAQLWTH